MKTNVKITKIKNCPTTTQLKLMHWLMHQDLSGGAGDGAGAGGLAHPTRLDNATFELQETKMKTYKIKEIIHPKT